jgi:hypothetical protein
VLKAQCVAGVVGTFKRWGPVGGPEVIGGTPSGRIKISGWLSLESFPKV